MSFIIFKLKKKSRYGLIVKQNGVDIIVAPMFLSDIIGIGWRIEKMPSLEFSKTDSIQIDEGMIDQQILVINKKYFDDGSLRYHVGMNNIFFVSPENIGIHKEAFQISLFESPKFPYLIKKIPDILQSHIDICAIIDELQKNLCNSEGLSYIYFNVNVSSETANLFINTFPTDKIFTKITTFHPKMRDIILHNDHFLDALSSSKRGWKIATVLPLSVLQGILSCNAIWVCIFDYLIQFSSLYKL